MDNNVHLIRTIGSEMGYGNDVADYNKPGDTVKKSDSEINGLRRKFMGDNTPSLDSRLITPLKDDPIYNHMPDTAFSAIGLADPKYSLYPLVSLKDWNKGILLNDNWQVPVDSLPDIYIDYAKQHGMYALKKSLEQGLLFKYRLKSGDHRPYSRKEFSFRSPNAGKYADNMDLYDYGLDEHLAEMRDGVVDKNKYKNLLYGLRGYSTDNEKSSSYDKPSIALIKVPENKVLTAKDKIYMDSAESDGPDEYRVHEYTIDGIWSPREVDKILMKYYPNLKEDGLFSVLRNDRDEGKAKDAVSEVIQLPAEEILSDETKKNIHSNLSGILSDDAMKYIRDCMQSDNILKGIKEYGQ